jgi:hypothetical protein
MEKIPFDGKTIDNLREMVERHERQQGKPSRASHHSEPDDNHVDEQLKRAS